MALSGPLAALCSVPLQSLPPRLCDHGGFRLHPTLPQSQLRHRMRTSAHSPCPFVRPSTHVPCVHWMPTYHVPRTRPAVGDAMAHQCDAASAFADVSVPTADGVGHVAAELREQSGLPMTI